MHRRARTDLSGGWSSDPIPRGVKPHRIMRAARARRSPDRIAVGRDVDIGTASASGGRLVRPNIPVRRAVAGTRIAEGVAT